jgi:hypothetical protein
MRVSGSKESTHEALLRHTARGRPVVPDVVATSQLPVGRIPRSGAAAGAGGLVLLVLLVLVLVLVLAAGLVLLVLPLGSVGPMLATGSGLRTSTAKPRSAAANAATSALSRSGPPAAAIPGSVLVDRPMRPVAPVSTRPEGGVGKDSIRSMNPR